VPWAVSLLGVSGAIALARLSFLLPYAVVGSTLMIGVAFWSAYRATTSCDRASCAARNRRALRVAVWVTAVIVGVLSIIALTFRVTI
jgi:hypothetical protein